MPKRFCIRFCCAVSISLVGDLELTGVNLLLEILWGAALDSAPDGVGTAHDLLDGTLELLGTALESHLTCNVENGGLGEVARVLDVLGFLTVTQWLLECLDEKACGIWFHIHLCGTVLDRQPHGHADALPGSGVLDDIITNLLR